MQYLIKVQSVHIIMRITYPQSTSVYPQPPHQLGISVRGASGGLWIA